MYHLNMAQRLLNLMAMICLFSLAAGGPLRMPVYFQNYTISEYKYQQSLPSMSESTICFWANFGADDDGYSSDYMFSVSDPSNADAYWIGLNDYLSVTIGGTTVNFDQTVDEISHLLQEWHKYCFVWKSNEYVKWYVDSTLPGQLQLMSTVSSPSYTIASGGALVLLQEQDSLFGSLDINEMMPAKIAMFNMWDHVLDDDSLGKQKCRDRGNVVNWDTLSTQGPDNSHYETFPCLDSTEFGGDCSISVYTQANTTDVYLSKTGLPAIHEFTMCFWISTEPDVDDYKELNTIISMSTLSDPNELALGWSVNRTLSISIRGDVVFLNEDSPDENIRLFTGWHKHCFLFKNGGTFAWYADRRKSGKVELIDSFEYSPGSIDSGAELGLLQGQDENVLSVVAGDWSRGKVTLGSISWFQMWDSVMAEEELVSLSCLEEGNLVSWATIGQVGSPSLTTDVFPGLPAQEGDLADLLKWKNRTDAQQMMAFCKVSGAHLVGSHNLYTVSTGSAARCTMLCAVDSNCLSVNYEHSTSMCTVNDDIDKGNEADFSVDVGFTFYTARECVD